MEVQVRDYEYVGSISSLGVGKLAKVKIQCSRGLVIKFEGTPNSRKSKLGRKKDQREHVMCKEYKRVM